MGILFKTWQELLIHNLHDHHLVQKERMGGRESSELMKGLRAARERQCAVPSGEHIGQSLLESAHPTYLNDMKLNHTFKRPVLFVESALWFL